LFLGNEAQRHSALTISPAFCAVRRPRLRIIIDGTVVVHIVSRALVTPWTQHTQEIVAAQESSGIAIVYFILIMRLFEISGSTYAIIHIHTSIDSMVSIAGAREAFHAGVGIA
jgi:hypothetical protein